MGCSVSCSYNFVTKDPVSPSNSFSSTHSPYTYTDSSSTPVSRTLSLPTPLVHHLPLCKGDTNHLVSLISSTYGLLDPQVPDNPTTSLMKCHDESDPQDLLSPDSFINTWELMEGLDDFDLRMIQSHLEESPSPRKFKCNSNAHDVKPLWKHLSEESLLAKMDPNVVLSYRKALSSKQFEHQESNIVRSVDRSLSSLLLNSDFYLKGTEDRIVLYYTSLRGIRKTYEDCCSVRMIFKGYRVCIDERDISMDSSYRKELRDILEGKAVSLPQVFIRGKYIGGVDEIKRLHETGELAKLSEGFPVKDDGFTCESCGEARFVLCPGCNGSRKLYELEEGKSRKCPRCNENGLIRCPGCCP